MTILQVAAWLWWWCFAVPVARSQQPASLLCYQLEHVCRNEGSSEALSLVCPTDASRRDDYGAVVHSFSTLQMFACEGSLLVVYTCQYVGVRLIRPVQGCLFAGS